MKKRKIFLVFFVLLNVISFKIIKADDVGKKISTAERIRLDEKGFSIIPPLDWEFFVDYPNLSFLTQIPFKKEIYQRSIQIMTFKGVKFIDESTANEFSKTLVQKFSISHPLIQDYRLRNYTMTKTQDGSDAILFYTEFSLNDKQMMQAHILMSSKDNHYLLTFTDRKDHFEGEDDLNTINLAWQAMTSIQLDSKPPYRFQQILIIIFILVFIGVFLTFLYFKRRKKAEEFSSDPENVTDLDNFDDLDGLDDEIVDDDEEWNINKKTKSNEDLVALGEDDGSEVESDNNDDKK